MAYSWNSELPSGHNPYWIRDEALAGIGLHAGDAVAVDTRVDAKSGDLVVAEVDVDGDSLRLARRYVLKGETVRLEPIGSEVEIEVEALEVDATALIVMGVIVGRLQFDNGAAAETPI